MSSVHLFALAVVRTQFLLMVRVSLCLIAFGCIFADSAQAASIANWNTTYQGCCGDYDATYTGLSLDSGNSPAGHPWWGWMIVYTGAPLANEIANYGRGSLTGGGNGTKVGAISGFSLGGVQNNTASPSDFGLIEWDGSGFDMAQNFGTFVFVAGVNYAATPTPAPTVTPTLAPSLSVTATSGASPAASPTPFNNVLGRLQNKRRRC